MAFSVMRKGSPANPSMAAACVSDATWRKTHDAEEPSQYLAAMQASIANTALPGPIKSVLSSARSVWCGLIFGLGLAFLASLAAASRLLRRRLSCAQTSLSP